MVEVTSVSVPSRMKSVGGLHLCMCVCVCVFVCLFV